MKQGLVSELAKAAARFDVACSFLDFSRIVVTYEGQPQKMHDAIYMEYEHIALQMYELRAYTPAWLVGWERRLKDTTRYEPN